MLQNELPKAIVKKIVKMYYWSNEKKQSYLI